MKDSKASHLSGRQRSALDAALAGPGVAHAPFSTGIFPLSPSFTGGSLRTRTGFLLCTQKLEASCGQWMLQE